MTKRLLLSWVVLMMMLTPWSSAQSLTLEEAEEKVLKLYGGEVLSVRTDRRQGVYVISVLLQEQTIRVVRVDVESGDLVE